MENLGEFITDALLDFFGGLIIFIGILLIFGWSFIIGLFGKKETDGKPPYYGS